MQNALFITNKTFLDFTKREGGVRNCTHEFIQLLSKRFHIIPFAIQNNFSIGYRIRIKLGLNSYNDYAPEKYIAAIVASIQKNAIKYVFLNLANTITFSKTIKERIGDQVKIILCSHGNESGDYLHQIVRFQQRNGWLNELISAFTVGNMLKKESYYRLYYIDAVLSISEVEEAIEKWLGAKHTYMVPRTIVPDFLELKPLLNTVGFMGDLSHTPNYTGLVAFCDAFALRKENALMVRVVGGPEKYGQALAAKYSFIQYCGFLNEDALRQEVATWACFLNIVWYYSRGVSTKLAKALSWGLPVISTKPGNRGYRLGDNLIMCADTPSEMVAKAIALSGDEIAISEAQRITQQIVADTPSIQQLYAEIVDQVFEKLQ